METEIFENFEEFTSKIDRESNRVYVCSSAHNSLIKIRNGLEIAPLSRTFTDTLSIQCRCSLKLLIGLSKHCISNDINMFFNLRQSWTKHTTTENQPSTSSIEKSNNCDVSS